MFSRRHIELHGFCHCDTINAETLNFHNFADLFTFRVHVMWILPQPVFNNSSKSSVPSGKQLDMHATHKKFFAAKRETAYKSLTAMDFTVFNSNVDTMYKHICTCTYKDDVCCTELQPLGLQACNWQNCDAWRPCFHRLNLLPFSKQVRFNTILGWSFGRTNTNCEVGRTLPFAQWATRTFAKTQISDPLLKSGHKDLSPSLWDSTAQVNKMWADVYMMPKSQVEHVGFSFFWQLATFQVKRREEPNLRSKRACRFLPVTIFNFLVHPKEAVCSRARTRGGLSSKTADNKRGISQN